MSMISDATQKKARIVAIDAEGMKDLVAEQQGSSAPVDQMDDMLNGDQADAGSITREMAQALGLTYIEDLDQKEASSDFVEKIPISFARQYAVLGLDSDSDSLSVAVGRTESWDQLDVLARFLGRRVEPVAASETAIASAINAAYQKRTEQVEDCIETMDRQEVLAELEQLNGREDLLDVGSRAPVIKLVNLILFEAVRQLVSDVHVQPFEDRLVVRMRIDGMLFDAFDLPKNLQEEVVSRIKVMGQMNIAEKRIAQDGRATVQVGDRVIDLRLASVPTSFGERIVIRLLDKSQRLYTLDDLGMDTRTLTGFQGLIRQEHGLILATGPTGSGKSTTLYAALQEIDCKTRNILTLEDPIEHQLPGISQTQVSEKKGMTFASGLRSVLRQDPDVIMVGEIRDRETAVMAIQSALTGHLVFSTLHTNDSASAVTRLMDLGIEPYLVASSLIGVIAQRLVRQVCHACKQPYEPSAEELIQLGLDAGGLNPGDLKQGLGCDQCRQTGYRGRVGIFELLTINEPIRQLVQSRATASEIKTTAAAAGMTALVDDAIIKMKAGITTAEEASRVDARMVE